MTARLLDGVALGKAIRQEVAADVARLAAAGVKPGLAVVRFAGELGGGGREEAQVGHRARDIQACGQRERLAGVARFEARQFFGMVGHGLDDLDEHTPALGGRHAPPGAGECDARGVHR